MFDSSAIGASFQRMRRQSAHLFSIASSESYFLRPIELRNPIVFYEGHLPAFAVNTLLKRALGEPGIDNTFEQLFARGIDPEDEAGVPNKESLWPRREEVLAYCHEADSRIGKALERADLDRPGDPYLDHAESVHTILEHELMHQETLMYIFHRLDLKSKQRVNPPLLLPDTPLQHGEVEVPAGTATLGLSRDRFGWDNEYDEHRVEVPAFAVDRHSVTNGAYREFVDGGGYSDRRWWSDEAWQWLQAHSIRRPLFWEERDGTSFWRGMFELIPLPESWPVYVSWAEANAYARWKDRRLMSEPEYHRAAFGGLDVERLLPWGDAEPESAVHGNFDFVSFDPVPAGSCPAGASAWGVHDLIGNGWEWTSSLFEPFPGFRPMNSYPQYSADFFDGKHFVMKGASPATPRGLIRRSFRNWFRPTYPYVYAKFRCARSLS